jgi:hypothetical protein
MDSMDEMNEMNEMNTMNKYVNSPMTSPHYRSMPSIVSIRSISS